MKGALNKFHIRWKGFGADPAFDWYFCFACFAAALALATLVDAYFYVDLMRAGAGQAADAPAPVVLNRANVDSVAQKAQSRDATPHAVPQSVLRDPSL